MLLAFLPACGPRAHTRKNQEPIQEKNFTLDILIKKHGLLTTTIHKLKGN